MDELYAFAEEHDGLLASHVRLSEETQGRGPAPGPTLELQTAPLPHGLMVFNRYPGGSTLEHDDAPKGKKRRRTSDRAPGCPRERGKVDGNVPGNLLRQRTDGAVGQHS